MKDKHVTEVVFRKWNRKRYGDGLFALFPYEVQDYGGKCLSYEHIAQHCDASYGQCRNISKPATKAEYADLKAELERIGYRLKVIKKRNYKKYNEEMKRFGIHMEEIGL
jgi:hypothetical protein